MMKRIVAASVLALAALGFAGTAQAHDEGPTCNNATTGVDGAGIWIDGVTGSGTCYGNDFISAENQTPHHGHCTIFLVVIADCTTG